MTQLRAAVAGAGAAGRRLGQGDPLGVQLRLVDAVVLGVVLPDVGAVGDLAEDLAPVGLGRRVEDGVEGRLDGVAAVAREQLGEPAGAHQAGGALGVEVGGEAVRHPAVAGHDPQRGLVGHAGIPQLDRGHRQALLEHGARVARHRAGHGAADVVVVAERLHERDDLALVEDRHGDAQVGQVADAALRLVDVVVEEHVALAHLGQREVAHDRVHEGGVGAPGELAQLAVVDAGAEVVRVADHRGARGAGDGGLDLHLDARQGALHDLDEDRVDRAALRRSAGCRARMPWAGRRCSLRLLGDDEVAERVDAHGEAGVDRHRRAELLDDRRAGEGVAGAQVGAPVDVGGDVPGIRVEADVAASSAGRVPARTRCRGRGSRAARGG